MKRTALARKTALGNGPKSEARGSTFATPRSELRRDTPKARATARAQARRPISAASAAQRDKVRLRPCVRCEHPGPCDPGHLIDRGIGGDDDPRAVVPLCRPCHHLYDDGKISLLEHLEPHFRAELAYAVELVGLIAAINRITNERYLPDVSA